MLNLNLLKPNRIIVTISKTVKSEKKGQNSLTSVSWMWIFSGVFLSRWRRSVTPTWWWRGFPTRPPFMRTTSATWPWTCWAPSTTSKTLPPEITSRSESVSRTTVSRDRAHRLFRLLLAVGRPRAQGRPPAAASELAGIQCLDPCSSDFCRLGCLSTQPPPTRKYDLGILWHKRNIFVQPQNPWKKDTDRDTDSFLSQGVTVLTSTSKHKLCQITVYIPNCVSDLVNYFSWGLETGSRNSEAQTVT